MHAHNKCWMVSILAEIKTSKRVLKDFTHSMLSAVMIVSNCALDWLAQLPVSLNFTTSRQTALFVGGSTSGKHASRMPAYDCVWKQCSRIKNLLRLFKNHFHSSHKFTSTQRTNSFQTAVQWLSYIVLVCTNILQPCFHLYAYFHSSLGLQKFGLCVTCTTLHHWSVNFTQCVIESFFFFRENKEVVTYFLGKITNNYHYIL